jgi:phage-related protein
MNKTCEYIAYVGEAFTIEWYFDPSDKSEALDYYKSLNTSERIQLLKLFKRMGDIGEIKDLTKFRNEGDKIYAFKPQPDRFLCFFNEGSKIIVTNGFRKKQSKLPTNEKENATKKRDDYLNRIKLGLYYD